MCNKNYDLKLATVSIDDLKAVCNGDITPEEYFRKNAIEDARRKERGERPKCTCMDFPTYPCSYCLGVDEE